MSRPRIVGPDSGPEPPYPIKLSGKIIKGFGRGSKELGIPTANIPIEGVEIGGHSDLTNGIYYGWAGISFATAAESSKAAAPPGSGGGKADTTTSSQDQNGGAADVSLPNAPKVYPMVMSIGLNPFYNNTVKSVEVHIIESFRTDFYNALMNLSITGFIRPERNYDSLDALVEDINFDIEVSKTSLAREAYTKHERDPYLLDFRWGDKA